MRRRSRSPYDGPRGAPLAVLVIVAAFLVVPAASYTTGSVPRASGLAVADDPNAVVGLDVANGVTKNNVDPLVNVSNNHDRTLTVTVTLQDGSQGDLYVDGQNEGDSATVSVAPSDPARTVHVEATGQPNTQLSFDTSATATGLSASIPNRQTTIEPSGGGGPPGGGPPGGGPPGGGPPGGGPP